jgi:aminoglycoside 6'-N-acetyltransferase
MARQAAADGIAAICARRHLRHAHDVAIDAPMVGRARFVGGSVEPACFPSMTDPPALPSALVLRGERLLLRPARAEDAPALAAILAEPEVAAWWRGYDRARVEADLREQPTLAIEIDGAVAGWLQVSEERDALSPCVSFDIALTSKLHDRGYGREALHVAIAHYVAQGHHRFTIDPLIGNERAIRCYAAVGFKPVGVLRAYERTDDGGFHDGLLMDLLAAELVR